LHSILCARVVRELLAMRIAVEPGAGPGGGAGVWLIDGERRVSALPWLLALPGDPATSRLRIHRFRGLIMPGDRYWPKQPDGRRLKMAQYSTFGTGGGEVAKRRLVPLIDLIPYLPGPMRPEPYWGKP
jgi:hypothetical protein